MQNDPKEQTANGANGKLEKRKARVVAKGYSQRPGIDFQAVIAPVARLGSLNLLIGIIRNVNITIGYHCSIFTR